MESDTLLSVIWRDEVTVTRTGTVNETNCLTHVKTIHGRDSSFDFRLIHQESQDQSPVVQDQSLMEVGPGI